MTHTRIEGRDPGQSRRWARTPQGNATAMVLNFYGLAEQPFGISPDPRFLFFSSTHREALASTLCAISAGRGFAALIAKPGMGKTTLLFDLLSMVRGQAKTAFLFQSQCTPRDLLSNLLEDLGIHDDGRDMALMQRKLNHALLNESRQGRQLVVVIDEAQNLDESVLEMVRMLSNFETPREKLIQFVLAGQPQLAEKLASPRLLQLRQRLSIIARIQPFTVEDTRLYIDHRLHVAGGSPGKPLFTTQALTLLCEYAEGIPRNINNVCFNALSLGCVAKQKTIDAEVIREVIDDLSLSATPKPRVRRPAPASAPAPSPRETKSQPTGKNPGTNLQPNREPVELVPDAPKSPRLPKTLVVQCLMVLVSGLLSAQGVL
jgi:general secretion pathway protein A